MFYVSELMALQISEEDAVGLTNRVPFLVENELPRLGAIYEKVRYWQPFSIVDYRSVSSIVDPARQSGRRRDCDRVPISCLRSGRAVDQF